MLGCVWMMETRSHKFCRAFNSDNFILLQTKYTQTASADVHVMRGFARRQEKKRTHKIPTLLETVILSSYLFWCFFLASVHMSVEFNRCGLAICLNFDTKDTHINIMTFYNGRKYFIANFLPPFDYKISETCHSQNAYENFFPPSAQQTVFGMVSNFSFRRYIYVF